MLIKVYFLPYQIPEQSHRELRHIPVDEHLTGYKHQKKYASYALTPAKHSEFGLHHPV